MRLPFKISLMVRVFVYGTLKKGYEFHDDYCIHAKRITPSQTWARLYDLPVGYPAIELSNALILCHGTLDYSQELKTQDTYSSLSFERPSGDWDLIKGELMEFPDITRDLGTLDKMEGYRPGNKCLYHRVLIPVKTDQGVTTAWTYDGAPIHPSKRGKRLHSEWTGSTYQ